MGPALRPVRTRLMSGHDQMGAFSKCHAGGGN
jgi:hypothetical protein